MVPSSTRPATQAETTWVGLFAVLVGIAWLIPDHYLPWTAFHSDLAAALGLGAMVVGVLRWRLYRWRLSPAAWATFLLALVPVAQVLTGHIHFAGDGWMAALYLTGFGLAVAAGQQAQAHDSKSIEPLIWVMVVAGLVSAGLAAAQWLRVDSSGVPMMRLVQGARPYANLGQPNQLATILMLALVSAVLLYQWRRLGTGVLAGLLAVLLLGVALTGSRTGWIEMVGMTVWVLAFRNRSGLRLTRAGMAALAMTLMVMVAVLPLLSEWLLVAGPHTVQVRPVGARPIHWAAIVDAISREPWFGYGWNQVSVAVSRVALDHPAPHEMIEHSHNLVLDLMVWNGVPLALVVVLCIGAWIWHHGVRSRDATSTLLVAMVGVTLVHAMFEFPLEYAYLLLPVGFIIGVLEAIRPLGPTLAVPRWAMAGVAVVASAMTAWVALEYLEVEEASRALRFQAAGIGPPDVSTQTANLRLLTQQQAYLQFARTQARRGMHDDQLGEMQRVSERFGHAPVLFRFALANALNGRPLDAANALDRLCRLQSPERCHEAKENWRLTADSKYPEIRSVAGTPAPYDASMR